MIFKVQTVKCAPEQQKNSNNNDSVLKIKIIMQSLNENWHKADRKKALAFKSKWKLALKMRVDIISHIYVGSIKKKAHKHIYHTQIIYYIYYYYFFGGICFHRVEDRRKKYVYKLLNIFLCCRCSKSIIFTGGEEKKNRR